MTPHPDQIMAVATTAELLAALESFEATGCHFGATTNAYIRQMRLDPNRESFEFGGMEFEASAYRRTVLILSHVAKPHTGNMDVLTLRPFGSLLAEHEFTQARLVAPRPMVAWVEVTKGNGLFWRRLRPEVSVAPAPIEEEAHVAEPA